MQSGPSGSTPRWRLWNPEHEVTSDDLWSDVLSSADLYLDTVANDPTLMEMSAAMSAMTSGAALSTPTGPSPSTSLSVFRAKGKWPSPSDDIRFWKTVANTTTKNCTCF
jgi:hypothetical protein